MGLEGGVWGSCEAASTDHTGDQTMLYIPIGSCAHIAVQISTSVNSLHTWMHVHTWHKSTQGGNLFFSPLPFLCTWRICSNTFTHALKRTCMDTHAPSWIVGYRGPVCPMVAEQLGWVIIICELWLTLTLSGWSAMMGWACCDKLQVTPKGDCE